MNPIILTNLCTGERTQVGTRPPAPVQRMQVVPRGWDEKTSAEIIEDIQSAARRWREPGSMWGVDERWWG